MIDFKLKQGKLKKKANKIVNVIKTIDMATITFFIGILTWRSMLLVFMVFWIRWRFLLFGENPAANENALNFWTFIYRCDICSF